MRVETACNLVNRMVFHPGWKFTAEDHSDRHEGCIKVHVEYPACNTNRDQAADGYPEQIVANATFPLVVDECPDVCELIRMMLLEITARIHEHEDREAMRLPETWSAPFHPHTVDGMKRWGNVKADLTFGVV